jgi:hypothetical protein
MTHNERLIGISVIIADPSWSPYERVILEAMRQAIEDRAEEEWIAANTHHDQLVATMWLKINQRDDLAAHVVAVIDLYRTQNA